MRPGGQGSAPLPAVLLSLPLSIGYCPSCVPKLGPSCLGNSLAERSIRLFFLPFPLGAELQQVTGEGSHSACPLSWPAVVQRPTLCSWGRSPPSLSRLPPSPMPSAMTPCPSFPSQQRLWINTAQATRGGGGVGHVCQKSTILIQCTDPRLVESGGVDSGKISVWTGEILNCALGPSGTGLGNMQAGLIFSQHSKYCPLYFSTGNPVMSWEQGLPRNSVPWGRGEGGAWLLNIFSLVLAKPELLVPRVSGVFPFKDIGAAEISSSPFL